MAQGIFLDVVYDDIWLGRQFLENSEQVFVRADKWKLNT